MERNDAMVDLAGGGLLATNKPTAEAHPTGARAGTKRKEATSASPEADDNHHRYPKRKEASASESENDDAAINKEKEDGDSLFKEGEMLKLREELREAQHLWGEMREKAVRGALARKITQVPAVHKKKKKKVVRVILPDACIDYIIENPCMMIELSDKEMAECSEEYRQSYAMTKIINAKKRAYHQALIEQRRAFGFAYDEVEVTDDEDEEVAVVKN